MISNIDKAQMPEYILQNSQQSKEKIYDYLCKLSTYCNKVSTSFTKYYTNQRGNNTIRSDLHYRVTMLIEFQWKNLQNNIIILYISLKY